MTDRTRKNTYAMAQDERIKIQVEELARALDDNGGHALSDPGVIDRETWMSIARHIPVDVIKETQDQLKMAVEQTSV